MRIRKRSSVAVVVTALLVTGLVAVPGGSQSISPAVAAEPSGDFVMHEEYFESLDGTVLHAYVYRPVWVGDAPTPVQLMVTPYANSGGQVQNFANLDPFREPGTYRGGSLGYGARSALEGYTAVAVSLRGHGGSQGCTDLGGPLEQADARAAVEWARTQPWSNGKVGVTGLSYPGLGALMTLALRDDDYQGPDAIVFASAPTGYEQFWDNGVPQMLFGQLPAGWWVNYRGSNLLPPSLPSSNQQHANHLTGLTSTPRCDPWSLLGNTDPDPGTGYWRERDMAELVAGAEVPVLGFHGFDDPGVPGKQLFPVMEALAGPWLGITGPWLHGPEGTTADRQDVMFAWLNHHLRGEPLPEPLSGEDPWLVLSSDGQWRDEPVWPAADGRAYELPLLPGTYLDMHGNQSETEPPDNVVNRVPVESVPLHGIGVWTFSPPLDHVAHLSGRAPLRVEVDTLLPGAHVIALLYEIQPDGSAVFVTRGASTVPGLGTSEVTFDLRPHDWKFPAGSRIGLLVTGADDYYYGSGNTFQPVQVRGGSLDLPLLRHDRGPEELGPDALGFRGHERPQPFQVDAGTIADRTADVAPPPPMEPRPGTRGRRPPHAGPPHR